MKKIPQIYGLVVIILAAVSSIYSLYLQHSYNDLENSYNDLQHSYNDLENSYNDFQHSYNDLQNSYEEAQMYFAALKNKRSALNDFKTVRRTKITSSRIFAGPNQYPPRKFTAYGIFSFPERATSIDLERQQMFCKAYMATIPHSLELSDIPISKQMVTVWPIEHDSIASRLNRKIRDIDSICLEAVKHYGLLTSLKAIKDAELSGIQITARGPFLFAWSPPEQKGEADVIVLSADLSKVATYQEAKSVFVSWRNDIEENSELWEQGFKKESLKTTIRRLVDTAGPALFSISKFHLSK